MKNTQAGLEGASGAAERLKNAWSAREAPLSPSFKEGGRERELAHLCSMGAWKQAAQALRAGALADSRSSAIPAVSLGLVKKALPIQMASAAGEAGLLRLMLELGADPNAANGGEPARPLFIALQRLRSECVEALLEGGAGLKIRGPLAFGHSLEPISAVGALIGGLAGAMPLHDRVSSESQEAWIGCARALARHGADLNEPLAGRKAGVRPLEAAVDADLAFAVEELLALGADPALPTAQGQPLVDMAIRRFKPLAARALIAAGCAPSESALAQLAGLAHAPVDEEDWDYSREHYQAARDSWRACLAERERQELGAQIQPRAAVRAQSARL